MADRQTFTLKGRKGIPPLTVSSPGYFTLEHVATGRYLIEPSKDFVRDIERHWVLLQDGRHPLRQLQSLYGSDEELRAVLVPTRTLKVAQRLVKGLKQDAHVSLYHYLLMNKENTL